MGRSEGWLIQVENGRADPHVSDLVELARVLQVGVIELLDPQSAGAAGPSIAGGTARPWQRDLHDQTDPQAQERLLRVASGSLRADMQVVHHLQRLLADWRALDDLLGPRALLPLTLPVSELIDELSHDAETPVRNALLTCGAEYQQFAGWLWVDLGDHHRARAGYEGAIARAVQSGRDELAGYLLACQAEHAIVQGRMTLGRSLAQAARERRRQLTPAVLGWAADLEARTWAATGREAECRRKLEEARQLLHTSADRGRGDEPPWIYHFVEDAFRIHEGMCLADLGIAPLAIADLEATIAALDPGRVRDRAYYLSYLAAARARAPDPEGACSVGQEALGLALQTSSRRVVDRLERVMGELRRFRGLPPVEEFSDALREARPTA